MMQNSCEAVAFGDSQTLSGASVIDPGRKIEW
jgi:hypothetical protein